MAKLKQEILDYYDLCETDYRRFWDLDTSRAMHSGYWDETTSTLRQALLRENEVMAEIAAIKPGDRVLDAGCGVGGSSFFLAAQGCSVDGINISQKQVENARAHAATIDVNKRPRFHVMDYTATSFLENTFDVVWAIESVCHAEDKEAFVKEAHRILKPGGRLIVADGFLINEGEGMKTWLQGWACPNLAPLPVFKLHLKKVGFELEEARNITPNVMPSSRRLYWIASATIWLSKLLERFGLRTKEQTDNLRAAYWHHKTLKRGDWLYYIIMSVKT